MAVEQPLGLTLKIMRMRSFARTWQDVKRPRGDDEEMPHGVLVDWVYRIQDRRDRAELERVMGSDPFLKGRLTDR